MSANPYQSPRVVDDSVTDRTPDGWHAIGIGFLGGAFVGGTAGAAQGAMLAVITLLSLVEEKGSTVFDAAIVGVMAATILGSLCGSLLGCVVGPLVGGCAKVFGRGSRNALMVVGVTTSTFSAVIVSLFAIQFLTGRSLESTAFWDALAIFSAIGVGFVGGVVLVRGMMRLLWSEVEFASERRK